MKNTALTLLIGFLFIFSQHGVAQPRDARDAAWFEAWFHQGNEGDVSAFEAYLRTEGVWGVVPLHELLRTASMWQECHAPPFEVPPVKQWSQMRSVLRLVADLQAQRVIGGFEVVSAYRNEALNICAGGASQSTHLRSFAVDLLLDDPEGDGERLCAFWRTRGAAHDMGLSRYPSGRIHIDTSDYRAWGGATAGKSSFCK